MPLYDITTGTGDFIANGVVSHNCSLAPRTPTSTSTPGATSSGDRRQGQRAGGLRAELARPSWKREHVALGTNTDPYQWVEGRYQLMRGNLGGDARPLQPCSAPTKSPLLLRDLELMREITERTEFTANLSIPTLDEKAGERPSRTPRIRASASRRSRS